MEKFPTPEKRKERTYVTFGENGHELEYVFTMPYAASDLIPGEVTDDLSERLGEDWEVLDRGSRLEIRHRKDAGKQDDALIVSALQEALGEGYETAFVKK